MSKRFLEISEWSEYLRNKYLDEGMSVVFSRHALRTLPTRLVFATEPFSTFNERDKEEVLSELQFAIRSVSRCNYPEVQIGVLDDGLDAMSHLLGDLNLLDYDEFYILDDESQNPEVCTLASYPLFGSSKSIENPSGTLLEKLSSFDTYLRKDNRWLFWRDWYQGFLDGKPLDWELQRRVAMIADEDWDEGPAHIAAKIEEIREPFILKERISELEALLPRPKVSRLGIGGNSPPENIDDIETRQQAITIVWAALDDLKAEAEEEHPNWQKVKASLAWLQAVLGVCIKWVGGHVDAGIREAAKTGGKAAGVTGVGYVALTRPEAQAALTKIVESAQKWFNFFN